MDGVLEGAVVWCACKLACSLLLLPSLATSHSSISFCCCCLVVFTDFLVTASLGFICIFESWLSIQTSQGDVIALRFLLFLGHTYGIILLLIIPLIAVETLTRLVWTPRAGEPCYDDGEDSAEKEEKEEVDTAKDKHFSHLVSYLCCLSVWVVVALNVRCRLKLEEVWAAADCLYAGDSFLGCLPSLLSPLPWSVHPYWDITFFSLLMFFLAISVRLDGQQKAPEQTKEVKHSGKTDISISSDGHWQGLIPIPSERADCGKSTLEVAQGVDPEKTESSCIVHKVYSWNSEMSTNHRGDIVLIPPDFISAGKGGQEKGRTKRGIILTFIAEDHVDWEHSSLFWWGQRGFPCLGVNVMIGLVGVLAIFVLPLNLSVNILLIRTVETVLVACIKSLVSFARNKNNAFILHNETLI